MEIGSILLGAALLILVGLFLARPFLHSNAGHRRQRSMRQDLVAQKEAVLAKIQVLEFDYETGTLPELDYKQQRKQLVAEAAEILKKLDEMSPASPETASASPVAPAPALNSKADNEIEAAVARLRQRPPRPAPPAPVKAAPKPEKQTPAPTNGRVKFCPQCGRPVEEGDNFCAYCGHKIHHPQPS